MEGLTEGKIVHFVTPNGNHMAAIIIHVWRIPEVGENGEPILKDPENGMSDVVIFVDPTDPDLAEQFLVRAEKVTHSEDPRPLTWHWIEKE